MTAMDHKKNPALAMMIMMIERRFDELPRKG